MTDAAETNPPATPDELHEQNVRIHGRARAEYARWKGLMHVAEYLYRCEKRRKERAQLEALEALERAQAAEEGEARWMRIAAWCARRVDSSWERVARRPRLLSRGFGFGTTLTPDEPDESDPLDLEDDPPPDW